MHCYLNVSHALCMEVLVGGPLLTCPYVHLVFAFEFIRNMIYPVQSCIQFNATDDYLDSSLVFHNAAFRHACILTASSFDDFLSKRPATPITYRHLHRSLALLNDNLSERDAHLSDANVAIVRILALTAQLFGDHAAAASHLSGLMKIIELRGGVQYLRCNPKLYSKIDRYIFAQKKLRVLCHPNPLSSPLTSITFTSCHCDLVGLQVRRLLSRVLPLIVYTGPPYQCVDC